MCQFCFSSLCHGSVFSKDINPRGRMGLESRMGGSELRSVVGVVTALGLGAALYVTEGNLPESRKWAAGGN